MEEAKRQVQNSPSVKRIDNIPDSLIAEFPELKDK